MDIVILDLEWNAAYSRRAKGYLNEIIEFGAVKCGPDLEVKSVFSQFVKPQVGKHVNSFVADLTRITDENLTRGEAFMQVVSRFRKWAGNCLILTWGTSDVLALIENCRYFSGRREVPFLQRYCDLQQYAQRCLEPLSTEQLGLEKAAELLGVDVSNMALHRARDDSLLALEILRAVYDPEKLERVSQVCDQDFYDRVTFKTAYICDLKDPRVGRLPLRFFCPRCGKQSRRVSRWSLKNKIFRAKFRCGACGHSFGGRLIIKQKYEGITVNQKTFPLPVIEEPRKAVPGPVGNMRLEISDGVGVLRFPGLDGLPFVNAAFTTRLGGVSEGEFATLNLGFGRGDEDGRVAENYRRFCRAAGFDSESLVTGNQDHHVNILRVGAGDRGLGVWLPKTSDSVDGLCTDDPGVTLVIYCADCVPLYFADGENRAIGLAHAGWRGTAAGMARVMAERMTREFGTRPEALRVAVGPSICGHCFEVDAPVAAEFLKLPFSETFVFGPETTPAREEKYRVDLWECNRRFLLEAGVPPENITVGGVCTLEESGLVFSHRKTQGKRGSNAAFLSLKG